MCKDWNAKIEINSWGSYILVRKVDDFDWTYYLGSDLKYILVAIKGFAKNKNALSKDFTQLMKFVKNIAIINKST